MFIPTPASSRAAASPNPLDAPRIRAQAVLSRRTSALTLSLFSWPLPFHQSRSPCQTGSERRHENATARLDPPCLNRFIQCQRNRRCRGVPVAIHIDHEAIWFKPQTFGDGVENPNIRLMRDEQIHVL